jgi:hypothetical protein
MPHSRVENVANRCSLPHRLISASSDGATTAAPAGRSGATGGSWRSFRSQGGDEDSQPNAIALTVYTVAHIDCVRGSSLDPSQYDSGPAGRAAATHARRGSRSAPGGRGRRSGAVPRVQSVWSKIKDLIRVCARVRVCAAPPARHLGESDTPRRVSFPRRSDRWGAGRGDGSPRHRQRGSTATAGGRCGRGGKSNVHTAPGTRSPECIWCNAHARARARFGCRRSFARP